MRRALPCRRALKASLHRSLFRWNAVTAELDVSVRPQSHVRIDLSSVPNPLFRRYGEASGWEFGLTLTPRSLLFHFQVPHPITAPDSATGIDVNVQSADLATSDGVLSLVDLRPVTRVQERMVRKRQSIQRHISKDLRHQRAVLRRYRRRETQRVTPLLHGAANSLLAKAGTSTLVFENLNDATDAILRRGKGQTGPVLRRRLSAWTHGRLVELVNYKARTRIVWVNPEGTSQECPRCGGRLALPSEGRGKSGRDRMTRRVVCGECGGEWHRDAAAAIAVLARGCRILRGAAVTPSARDALLKAAAWRRSEEGRQGDAPHPSSTAEPMNGDDAKFERPGGSRVSG
jgi:putative transposase